MALTDEDPQATAIVDYWLGDSILGPNEAEARHKVWYQGGRSVDQEIDERFGLQVEAACYGEYSLWEHTPIGSLALVVLLDQFTRNLYRGTPKAYAGDKRAWQVADAAVTQGLHTTLPVAGQIFLLHPFHHCERLAEQNRGVAFLEALAESVEPRWRSYVQKSVDGFKSHRDIVARFGRFPHRNRTLGRATTEDEEAYLEAGAETFGQ